MSNDFQELKRKITRLTLVVNLHEVAGTIRRALGGLSGARHSAERTTTPPLPASGEAGSSRRAQAPTGPHADASVPGPGGSTGETEAGTLPADTPGARLASPRLRSTPFERMGATQADGEFRDESHAHLGLTRRYKLYVPPDRTGQALPLVVMLHGCSQDPDDFAAGTAMNEQARALGFYVLYPKQSLDANPSRCWNWFNHHHQQRGRGEPAFLADLTHAVIAQHDIDPRRVYIAGLSAGGAMAAIVASTYPEIFAAVGVHSGLPRGIASNVLEALKVMKNGIAGPGLPVNANSIGFTSAAAAARARITVPTIVFHGDMDRTVHPRNGEQVIAAVLGTVRAAGDGTVEQGDTAQGRSYTRTTHRDEDGQVVAEHWLLHDAGHAWSGGQEAGSYTDPSGPDASREMLRFFFAHPLRQDLAEPHEQARRADAGV